METKVTKGIFSRNPDDWVIDPNSPFHIAKEFMKAGKRLMAQRGVYGGARPCAVVWLLRFVQEDLVTLGKGGLSDRWEEVKRFAFDAGIEERDDDEFPLTNVGTVECRFPAETTPLIALNSLQTTARDRLTVYLHRSPIIIDRLQVSFELQPAFPEQASPRVTAHFHSVQDAFLYQMIHLIAGLGNRIRICKCCNQLFLAGRTDKEFCSGRCQARKYKRDRSGKTKGKKLKKEGGNRGTKG